MSHYRIYTLNAFGRINDPPECVDCADNEAALQAAKKIANATGRFVELWKNAHLVNLVAPEGASRELQANLPYPV